MLQVGRRGAFGMLAGLMLATCSPKITFVSSVRQPTAEPLALKGDKVAAVVMVYDPDRRKAAEDALAREITRRGAQGVPMYAIWPSIDPDDEAAARAALEQAEVKGVVVMRPKRVKKRVVIPARTYLAPIYFGYWGGYYPYGWSTAWGAPVGPYRSGYGPQPVYPYPYPYPDAHPYAYPYADTVRVPGHTETHEVVRVEILIYSLEQNQLVWAGESETTAPSEVDSFMHELVEATAEELARLGLLSN